MSNPRLSLTLTKRMVLFACIAIAGYIMTNIIVYFIIAKFGAESTRAMRIAAILQDVFMLIVPALATAMLITRRPADFLSLSPHFKPLIPVVAMATLVVAAPAMNCIIAWNESVRLPESMRPIEDALRALEANATAAVDVLQGGQSVGSLIMSILIVGIAAGFSEEIFFRGTFQRLLTTGGINVHAAIWSVAIVFSIMHLQFYGFVPRTLLGAFFGYLLVWSGSIWIPVFVPAFNNILYVVTRWIYSADATPLDTIGTSDTWPAALISAVATVACVIWLRRICRRQPTAG